MQGCEVFTPAVTRGFGLGQLETVLKAAMQTAGVDGKSSILLIEDHHMITDDILETINSLLSAGMNNQRDESYKSANPHRLYEPITDRHRVNRTNHRPPYGE